jgi:hypothetical protein
MKMKSKIALLAILAIALTLMGAGLAEAVTSQQTLTMGATISSTAVLSITATTITFANGTPGTPTNAAENGTVVTAVLRTGSATPATLYVLPTDLTDGTPADTIAASDISSTATNTAGTFFLAGPVTWTKVGSGALVGTGQSGSFAGTFSWTLANSFTYATGAYAGSAVYTLTAP